MTLASLRRNSTIPRAASAAGPVKIFPALRAEGTSMRRTSTACTLCSPTPTVRCASLTGVNVSVLAAHSITSRAQPFSALNRAMSSISWRARSYLVAPVLTFGPSSSLTQFLSNTAGIGRSAFSSSLTASMCSLDRTAAFFAAQVAILVFANWARPEDPTGIWFAIFRAKWWLTAAGALALGMILVRWFGLAVWKVAAIAVPTAVLAFALPQHPELAFTAGVLGLALVTATDEGELGEWFASSWGYAKLILPLLLGGVLVAGLLLGRPGHEGLVPSGWVEGSVGGNGLGATLFAAVAGALMYFATLTEVPILQGLIGAGMGPGPALALLLAGPALSLPNMIVIASVIGWKKTGVYVGLVVVMATLTGLVYGAFIA